MEFYLEILSMCVCVCVSESIRNGAYMYLHLGSTIMYTFIRQIKPFISLSLSLRKIPHRINMGINFKPTDLHAFYDYLFILCGRSQSISNICNYIANNSERD